MRALICAVILSGTASTGCASMGYGPVRPITNPNLQAPEAQVAAYGLDLITEARAFGPAYESLVDSGAMTATTGLRLVRVERTLSQGARGIYDSLAMIATLRRLKGSADDIARRVQEQWDRISQSADEVTGAGEEAIAEAPAHGVIRKAIRAINGRVAAVFRAAGGLRVVAAAGGVR